MKPLCDHPYYCPGDRGNSNGKSIYIGQDHHISYWHHQQENSYFPSGWSDIKGDFGGLCFYTAEHGSGALCNIPFWTHSWQDAGSGLAFMWASETKPEAEPTPETGVNAAEGKRTAQGPTTSGDAVSSRAVDGRPNGIFADGTCTQTGNEANSWWRVDLGEEMSVNNVVVFGRTDCCGERLSQFEVRVGSHDTFDKNEGATVSRSITSRLETTAERDARVGTGDTYGPMYVSAQGSDMMFKRKSTNGWGIGPQQMGNYQVDECRKLGGDWKPICDHASWCSGDGYYIGQQHHLSYYPYRTWSGNWNLYDLWSSRDYSSMCTWIPNWVYWGYQLCEAPWSRTWHYWQWWGSADPWYGRPLHFMCGSKQSDLMTLRTVETPGYYWQKMFEQKSCVKSVDLGARDFDKNVKSGTIIRYDIDGTPYVYYKRITPMVGSAYDLFTGTWSLYAGNVLNVDFKLYSTEFDVVADTNAWKFCNGDDAGVGFPRDCGPSVAVGGKWMSSNKIRSCGYSNVQLHMRITELPRNMNNKCVNPADETGLWDVGSPQSYTTSSQASVVSQGKPTSQSSEGWSGSSSRAVDGNTNSNYGSNSCTHTQANNNEWWRVDLQKMYMVKKVKVYNRSDCCSGRLRFFVRVGTGSTWSDSQNQQCGGTVAGGSWTSTEVVCDKRGSFVYIVIDGADYLTLCEVEVVAEDSSPPPPPSPQVSKNIPCKDRLAKSASGLVGRYVYIVQPKAVGLSLCEVQVLAETMTWQGRSGPTATVPRGIEFYKKEASFKFKKGGDVIELSMPVDAKKYPEITFEMWLKVSDYNAKEWVMTQSPGYGGEPRALVLNDDQVGGIGITVGVKWAAGLNRPPLRTWFHMVGVWKQNGMSVAYINGDQGQSFLSTTNGVPPVETDKVMSCSTLSWIDPVNKNRNILKDGTGYCVDSTTLTKAADGKICDQNCLDGCKQWTESVFTQNKKTCAQLIDSEKVAGLVIGGSTTGPQNMEFTGDTWISDLRVYKRALTANEVRQLYEIGRRSGAKKEPV